MSATRTARRSALSVLLATGLLGVISVVGSASGAAAAELSFSVSDVSRPVANTIHLSYNVGDDLGANESGQVRSLLVTVAGTDYTSSSLGQSATSYSGQADLKGAICTPDGEINVLVRLRNGAGDDLAFARTSIPGYAGTDVCPPPDTPPDPSASPTVSADPSASPTVSASPSPTASTCFAPLVDITPKGMVKYGDRLLITVKAPANRFVTLDGYTRPSTDYTSFSSGMPNEEGDYRYFMTATGNTRLYARSSGCPEPSPSVVVNVQSTVVMVVKRDAKQLYSFHARVKPAVFGQTIALYRVDASGREILTAVYRATTSGTATISRAFTGSGRFGFFIRAGTNPASHAGQTPIRMTVIH